MAKITKASSAKPGPLAPPEDQEQAPLPARKKPAVEVASAPVASKPKATVPSDPPIVFKDLTEAPLVANLPKESATVPVQGKGTATATLTLETSPAAPAQPAAAAAPASQAAPPKVPRNRNPRAKTPAAAITVVSVNPISDVTVSYGTLLTSFNLPNPVGVTLSNGISCTIQADWKNASGPIYDSNIAGTYAFVGTLTLPTAVTNPLGLTASVKVIVASSASSGAGRTSIPTEIEVESLVEFGKPTPKKANYKSLALIVGSVLGIVLGMIAVAWFRLHSPWPKSTDYSNMLINPGRTLVQTDGGTNPPPAGTFKAYPSPLERTVPTDIIDVSSGPAVRREWTNNGPTGPGVGSQWISVVVTGDSNVFNAPLVVNGTNNQAPAETKAVRPPRQSKPANTGSPSVTTTNVVKVEQRTVVIHEPSPPVEIWRAPPPPIVINEAPQPPPTVIIRQPPAIRVRIWDQPEFDQSPYRYPPIRY